MKDRIEQNEITSPCQNVENEFIEFKHAKPLFSTVEFVSLIYHLILILILNNVNHLHFPLDHQLKYVLYFPFEYLQFIIQTTQIKVKLQFIKQAVVYHVSKLPKISNYLLKLSFLKNKYFLHD